MATINFQLYDFQKEAVVKLRRQRSRLIGDEMGLGKTYEAITFDLVNRQDAVGKVALRSRGREIELPKVKKTLVIAPLSVLSSWEDHLNDLTNLPVIRIDPKKRDEFFRQCQVGPEGYYLIHWEGLRYMGTLLHNTYVKKGSGAKRSAGLLWFHVIADECHRLKGLKNSTKMPQMCRAAKKLRTVYKTAMSGTAADNKPDDLWGPLNWLWPNYYTAFDKFKKTYCLLESKENKDSGAAYTKIVGVNLETIGNLHREMEPWFIRRTKEAVLPDLPEKYYTTHYVDLAPIQQRAYDQMRQTMIAWLEKPEIAEKVEADDPMIASVVVAQLQRLQQFALGYMRDTGKVKLVKKIDKRTGEVTWVERPIYEMIEPSAKLDLLMELLEDTDEQVVVFSQFRGPIGLLAARLDAKKISYGLLTGDTKDRDRGPTRDAFQRGDLRVFAGTISSGGVGITLTAASTIVFLDRAWRAGHNLQAEDRLHRIGQKNAVQVIDIMGRNTVDLGRRQQYQNKVQWLRQILGDE